MHCDAEAIDALIFERLGGGPRWEDRSRPGSEARILRAVGPEGALIVKIAASRAAWRREIDGLRRMSGPLRSAGVAVPELLAADCDATTLVLTEVQGAHVDQPEPWAYRRAGEALAAVQIEAPSIEERPRDALLDEARRACEAAPLDAAVLRRVEARIGEARAFEGAPVVAHHGDVSPGSWLLDGDRMGQVGFSRSGWHVPEADLVPIVALAPPPCRDAFLAGWGGRPDEAGRERLDALVLVFAVRWAAGEGAEAGRRLLDRVLRR